MPTASGLASPTLPLGQFGDESLWADQPQSDGSVKSVRVSPKHIQQLSLLGTITALQNLTISADTHTLIATSVVSVAGKIGTVILNHNDITDWTSATNALKLWNAGTVNAIGANLALNAGGTLSGAGSTVQKFLGGYNAITNTPSIGTGGAGNGGGVNGNTWVVTNAGTVAADGIGAVNVSDQIVNNGSMWVRLPMSAVYGSMASQQATAVAISGGSITGQSMLGVTNGTMLPSLYPDMQWGVSDGSGFGLFLDTTSTLYGVNLNFNTGTVSAGLGIGGSLSVGGSLTVVGALNITGTVALGTVAATTLNVTNVTGTVINTSTLNAGRVVATSGSISGQATLGLLNSASLVPSLYPDLQWGVGDSTGYGLYLDITSTLYGVNLNFNTGTIGALSTGSITGVNTVVANGMISAPTLAAGDVSLAPAGSPLPDVFDPVFDLNGNIIAWYGGDGYLHVTGLDTGVIVSNGKTVSAGGGGSSDSIDVTGAPYNALGDGVESYGTITTSGNVLTIENFVGTVSLTAPIKNLATLMIGNTAHCGWGFQPYDNGQTMMLTLGDGTVITGQIVQWQAGSQVVVNVGSIAAITNQVGTVVCPTFALDRVGKYLLIEGQGGATVWANNFSTNSTDPTRLQTSPFISTIANVLAPNSVQTTAAFPLAWTNQPGHIMWGSNDAAGCAQAAIDAVNQGKRKLYFPVPFRLYLLLGVAGSVGRGRRWMTQVTVPDMTPLFNGVLWVGDNSRAYTCDTGGSPMDTKISQIGSEPANSADKMIMGRGTLRRCRNLTTINVFLPGDSQVCPDPQVQSPGWMQIQRFIVEFTKANPGKTINYYYFGIGGSTWASYNQAWVAQGPGLDRGSHFWNVPRPISQNVQTLAFMQNANQTGSGPAILPDLVFIGSNGGNDKFKLDPQAVDIMINTILAVDHGDGFGPPDIIMQTDNQATTPFDSMGNGGGVKVPIGSDDQFYMHYVENFQRTTALFNGHGLVDMSTQVMKSVYGWSPVHRRMRNVPQIPPQAILPGAPNAYTIPFQAQDYVAEFQFPANTNDAEVWAALLAVNGELSFGVSWNRGNRVRLRQGANGNLWMGVSAYGETVLTACSITAGSKVLTVGAPQVFTGQSLTMKGAWSQVSTDGAIFTADMAGKCITVPSNVFAKPGDSVRMLQRSFINGMIDANDVSIYDNKVFQNDMVAVPNCTISVGGVQFMVQDSTGQPDVVLFYPDGTIFNTQVAHGGYTSITQATLVDAAPQTAVPGTPIPAFIGRMAPRWFDTGLSLTALTTPGPGYWKIDISRNYFMLEQKAPDGSNQVYAVIANKFMRRFGGEFYPRVYVDAPLTMQFQGMYVDFDKPFTPTTTAWEIRGVSDPGESYYLGGVGGHPASSLRTDVTDVIYRTQDLSSY